MGTGESTLDGTETASKPSWRVAQAKWQALLSRMRAVDLDEPLIVVSLLSLCLLVRVLWLWPIEVYWDAPSKWHFARQWAFPNDFTHARWTHHMARFGINVPTYFAQLLFGTATRAYQIVPLASFVLQTFMVYVLARRLGGRLAGVLGALFMALNPGMSRAASELLPDSMAGTAATLAAYALLRFHEEEGRVRRAWLAGCALMCAWAYATKESSVLLFPGFGLAVWLSKGRFKEALALAGMLAMYGLLETLGFQLFTDYAHRLAVIQQGHGYYPPTDFWGLFDRFRMLDASLQLMLWLWVASILYHLGSDDKRPKLVMVAAFTFVFLLTFMVRRIHPLTVWQSGKPRYMEPAMGLMVVGAATFVSDALKRAWERWPWIRLRELPRSTQGSVGLATFALCTLIAGVVYADARPRLAQHPFVVQRQQAIILNDAFRRNLPIIERAENPRGLNTVYGIFLKTKYLVQSELSHDGWLPDIQEGVRSTRIGKQRYAYILRDARDYRGDELRRTVDAGCAIVVNAPASMRLNVSEKLPEHCKAPRGRELPR